ncbi:MAG: glycosyltransferase family 4 protein [Ardenticatenaceae bacterium]|nr:glycosyltransferase family 4 protein [Anaerolineales bacterium]MCB8939524.1 glycosyltransferase family 4 protein [Ardenticatenaceae bacterium]MCB8975058.1 glycosyltransferase family 4 protein [Ardenticatenaceae bacterium]
MTTIHQFVTGATPGNAIYNEALIMQQVLRRWGLRSDIFAERIHPSLQKTVAHYEQYRPQPDDMLLFHYSLGSALSDYVLELPQKLILRYHNVTPPHFLVGANPWLRAGAAKGRADLPLFASRTMLALADSAFNEQDLLAANFAQTAVLPLIQPDELFHTEPDPALLNQLRDGRPNLLFVGRISPNKRQEDLLKTLYFYRQINPTARLLLVGSEDGAGGYGRFLRNFAQAVGLETAVQFSGHVSLAQLAAYYRAASVYVCLSEHEGFCQPLVESMRFGLPIVAFASTAVPGTMGGSGILIQQKNYPVLAELIHLLVTDTTLRQTIITGQTERAAAFATDGLLEQFKQLVTAGLFSSRL